MPSRKQHEELSKILLGKPYSRIHRIMDAPSRVLGPRHRILLHDEYTALLMAVYSGDWKAYLAAKMHILLDKKSSR